MELNELTKIVFEEHKDSSFLVVDSKKNVFTGVVNALSLREKDAEPCLVIGKTRDAFCYSSIAVKDIVSIEPIPVLFDKWDDLEINDDLALNELFMEQLTGIKNGIKFNILECIKRSFANKPISYTLDDVIEVEEPTFVKGSIVGMHDVELVVNTKTLDFDAILEIATSDGVKSVRLKDIEVMY